VKKIAKKAALATVCAAIAVVVIWAISKALTGAG